MKKINLAIVSKTFTTQEWKKVKKRVYCTINSRDKRNVIIRHLKKFTKFMTLI